MEVLFAVSGLSPEVAYRTRNPESSCTFAPVELPGGWVGQVLVRCGEGTLRGARTRTALRVDDWRRWLEQLLVKPQTLPAYRVLKYSPTYEVIHAQLPGSEGTGQGAIEVVGKHETARSAVRRVAAVARGSRGSRNFARGWRLLRAGIGTAVPLAVIERRSSPGSSWLVLERLSQVMDLDQTALAEVPRMSPRVAYAAKAAAVGAVADLLSRLYREGLHHRDLKASNILLAGCNTPGGEPRAYVIDLDGLRRRRRWNPGERWQPLIRLAASLLGYPSMGRGDYARTLRAYLAQTGGGSLDWRAAYRRLSADAETYASRSRRRKAGKLDGYAGV